MKSEYRLLVETKSRIVSTLTAYLSGGTIEVPVVPPEWKTKRNIIANNKDEWQIYLTN